MVPADDQAIALPCASVIVIIVLLNVALTCATPDAMFLRSRFLTRASLAIPKNLSPIGRAVTAQSNNSQAARASGGFLLAGDRLGRSLAGAGIGVRALTAHRQTTAMTQSAIAAKVHQPLDV